MGGTIGFNINERMKYLVPLPNLGLYASFSVTPWLSLSGKFGMFYLRMDDFSGKINDLSLMAKFKLTKWMGVNIAHTIFDIAADGYTKGIKTTAEYNFRGPALGVSLAF